MVFARFQTLNSSSSKTMDEAHHLSMLKWRTHELMKIITLCLTALRNRNETLVEKIARKEQRYYKNKQQPYVQRSTIELDGLVIGILFSHDSVLTVNELHRGDRA
jgi:hypothetical protein